MTDARAAGGPLGARPERRWSGPRIESRLDLFSYLLALGVLVHQHPGSFRSNWDTPWVPVVILLAAALLLRPGSTRLLVAFLAAIVADAVAEAPFVLNHYVLLLLAGVVVLGTLAVRSLRRPRPSRAEISDLVLGVAGVALLAAYVLAAFHKLNADFLDPLISCAVDHYRIFAETWEVPPRISGGAPGQLLAIATIVVEFAIPALIVIHRWRVAGLALGVLFHAAMALNGHPAFSAIALACYAAFVPVELPAAMARRAATTRWASWVYPVVTSTGLAVALLGTLLNVTDIDLGNGLTARIPFFLVSVPVVALAIAAWWRLRVVSYAPLVPAGSPVVAAAGVTLVALTVNAAMPYLGVRSEASFSMFSNLRTEESAGRWNHYLVPEAVAVFDRHDTWVEILEPTAARPRTEGEEAGDYVNLFELRRAVSAACRTGAPVPVRYRTVSTGEIIQYADACTTDLGAEPGLLERKLVLYRPILDPNLCQH